MKMTLAYRRQHRVLVARMMYRKLVKIARRLGVDEDTLVAMADRCVHQCALCLEPFTVPHVYFWQSPEGVLIPRAVICSYCKTAIVRYDNDYGRLGLGGRFSRERVVGRERLSRLISVNATPNLFDPRDEYVPGTPVLRTDDTYLLGRLSRNHVL
jgi:hypothetical protein